MRFWDSSALVPLVLEQQHSVACRHLRRVDPAIAVWALTRTELVSAVHRLAREGKLAALGVISAKRRIDLLAARWSEVDGVAPVRSRAERLLAVHTLTSADALQLAAALVLAGDRPAGRFFICSDARLAASARSEGFDVVVPR